MNTKILTTGMLTVGLFFATSARAESWKIDTAHSSVSFSVKHMMVTNVRGDFKGIEIERLDDDEHLAELLR